MAKATNSSKLYSVLEWIMRIAYINLLWFGSVLLGLIVFGFYPASVAMYTVIRNLNVKNTDFNIFKTFITTYKKEFFKSNAIGFILLLIGYVLYLDLIWLRDIQGLLFYVMQVALVFVGLVYIITLLYIIPTYVHFNLKFSEYFKHALLIGLFSPLMTILMVIGLVAFYYLYRLIPGLIPVFGVGMTAAFIMVCALIAFNRFENKQNRINEVDSI